MLNGEENSINTLFAQLGLDSDDASIQQFIEKTNYHNQSNWLMHHFGQTTNANFCKKNTAQTQVGLKSLTI